MNKFFVVFCEQRKDCTENKQFDGANKNFVKPSLKTLLSDDPFLCGYYAVIHLILYHTLIVRFTYCAVVFDFFFFNAFIVHFSHCALKIGKQ